VHLFFVGLSGKILDRGKKSLLSNRIELNCIYSFFSLAIKNTEDNGPTKKDPASSDLLCDGEQ
jgi:hypothetical protein